MTVELIYRSIKKLS